MRPKKLRTGNKNTYYQKQLEYIKKAFKDCNVTVRKLSVAEEEYAIVFINGMVDKDLIQRDVIGAIFESSKENKNKKEENLLSRILLTVSTIKELKDEKDTVKQLLEGNTVLLIKGEDKGYSLELKGWPNRPLAEPETEVLVRGPHIGFTEIVEENTALIRRIIKSEKLKEKDYIMGESTKTAVKLIYLEGTVKEEVVQEVHYRLKDIKNEVILESGYVVQYITDNPNTPFPQVLRTERPDRVAANLLEGRVALLIDGTPVALIFPATLATFLQSPDEYNTRWAFGSVLRLIRWLGFFVSIYAPATYIAIVSKDFALVPIELLMRVAESRAGVPFPPLVEAFFMELTIEILREAGVRLPGRVGQTIGIVGAIVIGDAAVKAGIASNIMVVVVALTTIATFLMPVFEMGLAVRFVRFPMMILAGTFGIVGVGFGTALLLAHLVTLETCGVPYLEPFAPTRLPRWKDLFIRAPLSTLKYGQERKE